MRGRGWYGWDSPDTLETLKYDKEMALKCRTWIIWSVCCPNNDARRFFDLADRVFGGKPWGVGRQPGLYKSPETRSRIGNGWT